MSKPSNQKRLNRRPSSDGVYYENIFEKNVNFKERVIYLNSEIDEHALGLIQKALDEFERGETPSPVRIEISSYGGSVYDMLGIIDRIKMSDCHIVTRGFGKIMSAATLILAAGDHRVMGCESWAMIHELSTWIDEKKLAEMKTEMKHNEALEKQCLTLYEKLSKKQTSMSKFKKMCAKDFYLTADEMLEMGLIDEVSFWKV